MGTKSILIVEDEKEVSELVAAHLQDRNTGMVHISRLAGLVTDHTRSWVPLGGPIMTARLVVGAVCMGSFEIGAGLVLRFVRADLTSTFLSP